jgi:hypothetical protein
MKNMKLIKKIESACNKMEKGKLPGLIYLSKKTLAELAKELPPRKIVLKKENLLKTCYFITDNSLPFGKIRVDPIDEKYFGHERKLKAEGKISCESQS